MTKDSLLETHFMFKIIIFYFFIILLITIYKILQVVLPYKNFKDFYNKLLKYLNLLIFNIIIHTQHVTLTFALLSFLLGGGFNQVRVRLGLKLGSCNLKVKVFGKH